MQERQSRPNRPTRIRALKWNQQRTSFTNINSHVGPRGHVHEFLCVSTTWTISLGAAASPEASNTPETLAHQWQTPHAVILLVSGLILCSIHKLWFRYLILPPETELFLLALSFLPPPPPNCSCFSIFISHQP